MVLESFANYLAELRDLHRDKERNTRCRGAARKLRKISAETRAYHRGMAEAFDAALGTFLGSPELAVLRQLDKQLREQDDLRQDKLEASREPIRGPVVVHYGYHDFLAQVEEHER